MGRENHYVGLTAECERFVASLERLNCGVFFGMFDEEFPLYVYVDKETGEEWEEFVQYEPWSSGPWFLIGLRNKRTGEVKGWKHVVSEVSFVNPITGEFYL